MKKMILMKFRFRSLCLILSVSLFAVIPSARLLAQDGPDGGVPDDPSTAMTVESGDPINESAEDPNNQDVPADSHYVPSQEPFAPNSPDTDGNVKVTG